MTEGREGHLNLEGGGIWYEVAGDGPAVVLMHAGIADSRMWDAQFEGFAEHHRVVRFDVRGFGRSPPPTAPFSRGEDVVALMDHLEIPSAALVGCSMGGGIAISLALQHPDRVHALVPVATALPGYQWPENELDRQTEEAVAARDWDRVVGLNIEQWAPLRTDPEVDALIERMIRENARVDELPEELFLPTPSAMDGLEEIRCPTLVVVGETDPPPIFDIANILVERIPRAQRVDIAGADHLVPLRRPREFNEAVLGFVATLPA